ncbi:Oxysterol-binding protein-related protein 3 [Coccomyxa sp. Obi]|nr:Oxysterol-binding protein-related protein 3 [Coccomyxa sp. Obi]
MANLSGEARITPDIDAQRLGNLALEDSSTDGYIFNSQADLEEIKMQRQAIWDLLKYLGTHVLREGINLTKISLPVKVFEPRSFLQRLTDNWAYIDLLEKAVNAADPVERMQYMVAFVIGGLRRQTSTLKPFNPILGETYQGIYCSGWRVFAEQISHHPPISSWQVLDPEGKFQFSGYGNWKASARGNSIKGQQSGLNKVSFSRDGAVIEWELPSLLLRGILWGERSLKYSGTITFRDELNALQCDVTIDGSKQSFVSSLWHGKSGAKKLDQLHGTLRKGGKVVSTVRGSWLTAVEWEEGGLGSSSLRVWDAAKAPVHVPKPVTDPLPSDSRFRQDLHALQEGDQDEAQEWKSRLEHVQRSDAAMRAVGQQAAGL